MARIPAPKDGPPSSSRTPTPPPRRLPGLPGWVPLSLAVVGLGLVMAPDDAWSVRVVGGVLLAAGSFWLGQDRQHDPADRSRISQLEGALMRFGVLDRELAARHDLAAALGAQRRRPPAAPAEHGADGGLHPAQSGAGERPPLHAVPEREPDLDAPLPGDER